MQSMVLWLTAVLRTAYGATDDFLVSYGAMKGRDVASTPQYHATGEGATLHYAPTRTYFPTRYKTIVLVPNSVLTWDTVIPGERRVCTRPSPSSGAMRAGTTYAPTRCPVPP
eukprot:1329789-Rhodomonas_salina.3